jgi:hypothetical protein
MSVSKSDLDIAERHVSALECFIATHRTLLAKAPWRVECKMKAAKLLAQFEAALSDARARRAAIWSELNGSAVNQRVTETSLSMQSQSQSQGQSERASEEQAKRRA